MCVCVCVCACMFACVYARVVGMRVCACVLYVCVCVYACMCVCARACELARICLPACCVCAFVCVCVSACVCVLYVCVFACVCVLRDVCVFACVQADANASPTQRVSAAALATCPRRRRRNSPAARYRATSANRRPILKQLHWLPFKYRIDFKIAVLTYKLRATSEPMYL